MHPPNPRKGRGQLSNTKFLKTASVVKPQLDEDNKDKITSNADASQPLAPPPRPSQHNSTDTPDYFSGAHSSSHFSLEPNPFEQSFGNPSTETPGKSLLPPLASLTSPASLVPGGNSAGGFNWPNSLRSGPLSPAMLTGPTGTSDYFDGHLRGGFPTPNESSLRTGLTPGGGGSMFPAPSPNSQALFNQLASGGATPSTLEFHRTAMNAAAVQKQELTQYSQAQANASQAEEVQHDTKMDVKAPQEQNASHTNPFGQPDSDAANSLYLLAQARNNGADTQSHYIPANQQSTTQIQPNTTQPQDTPPTRTKRNARNATGSLGSISGSAGGMSLESGDFSGSEISEQTKPNTRNKGRKSNSAAKGNQAASNGRRKAEETPSKPPASKKAKGNSGISQFEQPPDSDEEEEEEKMEHENGRKMTDEEKRKNFLERNRYWPSCTNIIFQFANVL